jgi:hypothetical protein
MLTWKGQRNPRERLELKAQSGSIEDWKAYILWEKKGKKVQYRVGPVLYEHAIVRAASERWAAIRNTAARKLPFMVFGRTT